MEAAWFLTSLSPEMKGWAAHPMAGYFKKSIMYSGKELFYTIFDILNDHTLIGELPKEIISVRFEFIDSETAGETHVFHTNSGEIERFEILISPEFCIDAARTRDVILHELVHCCACLYFPSDKEIHGQSFHDIANLIGCAFPTVPTPIAYHEWGTTTSLE